MDHSKSRRGQPCWYLQNNIGLAAINDGLLLEQSGYQLLRVHFRGKPCYLDLIETFQQVSMLFRCFFFVFVRFGEAVECENIRLSFVRGSCRKGIGLYRGKLLDLRIVNFLIKVLINHASLNLLTKSVTVCLKFQSIYNSINTKKTISFVNFLLEIQKQHRAQKRHLQELNYLTSL